MGVSNYGVTMQGIMQDELWDMDCPIWKNILNEGGLVKDGASRFG